MQDDYQPRRYWESTLGDQFDLRGTGYPNLPHSFNAFLYASMRRCVDGLLLAAGVGPGPLSASVLDIGSGVGYWVDYWSERGVSDLTGYDLTDAAVRTLTARHPALNFRQVDIGSPDLDVSRSFDVISVMAVLQHITDDARFLQALANIRRLLAPGGLLLAIEPVVVHRWWGPSGPGMVAKARPLEYWERALADNGLKIARMVPVTWLLANPADTRRRWQFQLLDTYWSLVGRTLRGRERAGRLAGTAVSVIDRILLGTSGTGPSSKGLLIRPV
ncbi:MAG: class I SAM-dependent methyltransferase [Acidimicrobiales bacterium]